jgi:hypothetical protein
MAELKERQIVQVKNSTWRLVALRALAKTQQQGYGPVSGIGAFLFLNQLDYPPRSRYFPIFLGAG